jgi:hypothetical protein
MRITVLSVFVCLLLGCQAPPPIAAPPPPASVAPPEGALAAPATAEVWGQVPRQCSCHADPLVRVASDLQDLPVEFQLETASEGWQLFSVKFDPTLVSTDRIQAILTDEGARIIPAPVVGAL